MGFLRGNTDLAFGISTRQKLGLLLLRIMVLNVTIKDTFIKYFGMENTLYEKYN